MRTIKFRGRVVKEDIHNGGKWICGALAIYAGCKNHVYWIYPQNSEQSEPDDYAEPVDAETIEQLIAVDQNGAEVYEGDLVEDLEYNCLLPPRKATFHDYTKILDGEIVKVVEEAKHDTD